MLQQYQYLCCEMLVLLVILLSISPGTAPSERTYSNLENACKKRYELSLHKINEGLWLLMIFQLRDDEE